MYEDIVFYMYLYTFMRMCKQTQTHVLVVRTIFNEYEYNEKEMRTISKPYCNILIYFSLRQFKSIKKIFLILFTKYKKRIKHRDGRIEMMCRIDFGLRLT